MIPTPISTPVPSAWPARLAYLIVIALVMAVVGVVAWSLPRGFDITDEGFYMLNYRFPAEYEASFTDFHLVVTRVFGLADASILTYRTTGLIITVLGPLFFGLSLSAWLRKVIPLEGRRWLTNPGLVTGFVLLGTLLAYSITPRAISYNSINTLALLLTIAAVLMALRQGSSKPYWLLAVGLVLGLDVFVKVSSAILLVLSSGLVVGLCWRRAGSGALLRAAGWLLLGLLIGSSFYFLRAQTPDLWWHNFRQETAMIRSVGYGTDELLLKYSRSVGLTLRVLAWPLSPLLLAVCILAWWWSRRRMHTLQSKLLVLGILGIVAGMLVLIVKQHLWYSTAYLNQLETLPFLLGLMLLAMLVVVVGDGAPLPVAAVLPAEGTAEQLWIVGSWLLLLPVLAAVGTYNDLRLNVLVDVAPWFGLLLLVLAWPRQGLLPNWVVPVLLLLPAGFAAEQSLWGTLRVPYLLTGPMNAQTEQLRAAGLTGTLRLDAPTVKFVGQLEQLLAQAGFRPGDPLLAFNDMPGLVYLCGGVSPGAPWYFGGVDARICHSLSISHLPLRKACVLLNDSLGTQLQQCMREMGLRFPENYRLVGELPNPYLTNSYMYRQNQRVVKVYAPLLNN